MSLAVPIGVAMKAADRHLDRNPGTTSFVAESKTTQRLFGSVVGETNPTIVTPTDLP